MNIANLPFWLRRCEPVVLLVRWVVARIAFSFVIFFAAIFVTNTLVERAMFLIGGDSRQFGGIEQDRVWALLWVCTTLLTVLAYRPFFSWIDRKPADELAFTRKTIPDLARGALLAMLMLALPVLILVLTGSTGGTMPTPHRFMMAVTLAVHAAVMEEIIFRGFLLQFLLKFCHPIFATLVVAALFMAAHIPDGRDSISLVSVFLSGMAMTVAYFLTRSLWLPIGLHFGWDVILFLLREMQGNNRYAALPVSYFQVPLYLAEILVLAGMIGIVTYRAMNPEPSPGETESSSTA